MITYLVYALTSGIVYSITGGISGELFDKRAKRLGYINRDNNNTLLNTLKSFAVGTIIPPLANFITLLIVACDVVVLKVDDEKFINALRKSNNYGLPFECKYHTDFLSKIYDTKTIEEAMIIDGADAKTIEAEKKKMKKECKKDLDVISPENVKRINASIEAKYLLDQINLEVGLSNDEYAQLYQDHVRELASDDEKVSDKESGKILRKTLKTINRRN